jgi:type II secretory pathway pseudopilin PulG
VSLKLCFLGVFLIFSVTNDGNQIRQAKALQSSLQALAERIDAVKSDHDKLENENKILQDYIGGLTRNMTKSEMTRTTKARKAQK